MPIITTIDTSICYYQTFEGYNTTGVYTDTLTDIHGCDSVRNIKLTVVRAPEPHLGINQELCRGDSIILKPGTFNSYLWQDSSTTDNLIVKEPGTYIVSVTNDCGIARDTVNVTISPCNIYFPNAFSPNNDHLNDLFKILKPIGISNYYLAIYNRWGEKIFETNDISKGWDGTYKGSPMPPGIFIWYSRFAKSGQQEMIKGVLTLLR